jgi:ABC-type glutathione transport system ATPase component
MAAPVTHEAGTIRHVAMETVHARVALVGDAGVGKTALARVLAAITGGGGSGAAAAAAFPSA